MTMTDDGKEIAEARLEIINELGLHARAATKLVQLASKFPCELELTKDDDTVNGKSIMGVLMLVASKGSIVSARAIGPRAAELISAVCELVASRFGEAK
jgi:phosphocarrier protein